MIFSALPQRTLRLCGEDWGAHIFEPQRRRERRGNAEVISLRQDLKLPLQPNVF
jgi:hypothetical protein